jgi:hypothetical protein
MMTMDSKKASSTRRKNRSRGGPPREEPEVEVYGNITSGSSSNGHRTGTNGVTPRAEMQSSSPDDGVRQVTQAVAAAGRKEEESLYDQLLRHHKENNLDDSASQSLSNSDNFDAFSVMSEEDRKLPAVPAHGRPRRPILRPYSKNHAIVESGDEAASTWVEREAASTWVEREQGSTDGATKQEADSADDFYPTSEDVTRTLSGRSLPGSRAPPRRVSNGELDQKPTTKSAGALPISKPPRDRSSPRETSTSSMGSDDRKKLFKKSREQSSFYKAALKSAGESDPSPIPTLNDMEQDERLARELSQMIEEPPPPSALDEELARVLQASEPEPPEASEQDVVLALQLMEQEEKLQPSTTVSTSASTTALTDEVLARRLSQGMSVGSNTDEQLARRLSQGLSVGSSHADEQLARRLSQGTTVGPNVDELLARQLSQFEKPTSLEQAAKMVPEQLQILERIQQDKERKQIEQAMMASSLHELPVFQEITDTGIGRSKKEDYHLSQELALNEWTSLLDRRPEGRLSVGGGAGGSTRSAVSWNGLDRPVNNQVHRVHVPSTVRPQQYDGVMIINRAPGRAVSVDQGGRENPIQPRVGQVRAQQVRARSSTGIAGAREEQRSQDLVRPRPPEDLLQRGNQETRSAIASGRAHVVMCQGCDSRLHAPMNYSLVFCPTCNTISPGLTAGNNVSG